VSPDKLPAGAELLPAPTLDERHEINELMRAVRAYTHPVVFNTRNPHLGTAVFLRHGERLFAFTAAHNIKDDTTIHFRLSSANERAVFGVLSTYVHPKYDPEPPTSKFDLAILELEPNPAVTAGDVAQLYTGEFGKLPEGEHKIVGNAFVWVVGYPAELAKPSEGNILLNQTSFCTQILEHSPDEFSLHYPATGYQMPQGSTSCNLRKTTETPKGYSGGGVWVTMNPPGVLFNPHRHIKLVGIETHWAERSRLARCVPGKVIAEALKDFRPNL
jgi:hypothetical protein